MKRFIIFAVLFSIFCTAFAEDVDINSMSEYEKGVYFMSLSMPDALSVMEKLGVNPEPVFRYAYDIGLKEWETFPDVTLYLSYASMYTTMQERDLLKYLPILGIEIPSAPDYDYSDASFDDLVSLRDQILMEMMSRDEWQEVTVPVGTYQIGKHIPAGHWMIRPTERAYCYITIGGSVDSNGKDIPYGASGRYFINIYSENSFSYDPGDATFVDLELKDGMYISIENASAVFTPYNGQPDLGFSFK